MVKEVRSNRDYSDRTRETARWARDQIKRQTGKYDSFHLEYVARPTGGRPYGGVAYVQQHEHGAWQMLELNAQGVHAWYPAVVETGDSHDRLESHDSFDSDHMSC